ncbi:hypothetical protein PENSPDRAFT_468499 [Peniophora sp. CONT]|nr:hypothetical protein PENSPDRAFT_468499 [Peniophora sp. CONT]
MALWPASSCSVLVIRIGILRASTLTTSLRIWRRCDRERERRTAQAWDQEICSKSRTEGGRTVCSGRRLQSQQGRLSASPSLSCQCDARTSPGSFSMIIHLNPSPLALASASCANTRGASSDACARAKSTVAISLSVLKRGPTATAT